MEKKFCSNILQEDTALTSRHECAGVQHGGGRGDDERGGQERRRRHQLLGVPVHDGRQPRHAVNASSISTFLYSKNFD